MAPSAWSARVEKVFVGAAEIAGAQFEFAAQQLVEQVAVEC
jgi:hypothetical protein